jgi:hypothetical protein
MALFDILKEVADSDVFRDVSGAVFEELDKEGKVRMREVAGEMGVDDADYDRMGKIMEEYKKPREISRVLGHI